MRSSENSRPAEPHAEIRPLCEKEICRALFLPFSRRQVVTRSLRKVGGEWLAAETPFIDDWDEEDYAFLVECLRRTVRSGGIVLGAFVEEKLKGFASVEGAPFGARGNYRELTSLHVSEELRGKGVGRELFVRAKDWARAQGAEKLYISSHSAAETQAFYAAMGCIDAQEIDEAHARREPFDRPLECRI